MRPHTCSILRKHSGRVLFCLATAAIFSNGLPAQAQDPFLPPGTLVLGVANEEGVLSIERANGPLVELGAEQGDGIWNVPFLQSVEFDNLDGISHNPEGNLLALNFGSSDSGGSIWNLPTLESGIDESQMLGDFTTFPDLSVSRLGGLSVSLDNSKIAFTGYDTGRVMVFDYTAGDSKGAGASIANGRESEPVLPTEPGRDTQGSTWLDANNVLAFSADGDLVQVDANTMQTSVLSNVDTGSGPEDNRSEFTDVEYSPAVSDFIYASYSGFDRDTNETLNKLYVFDPNSAFTLVKEVDYSGSINSFREIAMGPDGTMYFGQFGSTVDFVEGADVPASLQDDVSTDWYIPSDSASFSGLDVAVGLPLTPEIPSGDFDGNGVLDADDINALTGEVNAGTNDPLFDMNFDSIVDQADRTVWVEQAKGTYFGDANLDGEFSSSDLVAVFAAGEYEDDIVGNSLWQTGDWDGNTEFDSSDIVTAFAGGGFELGPRAAVVPEPAGLLLFVTGLALIQRRKS